MRIGPINASEKALRHGQTWESVENTRRSYCSYAEPHSRRKERVWGCILGFGNSYVCVCVCVSVAHADARTGCHRTPCRYRRRNRSIPGLKAPSVESLVRDPCLLTTSIVYPHNSVDGSAESGLAPVLSRRILRSSDGRCVDRRA
jgi:hypothetical protein